MSDIVNDAVIELRSPCTDIIVQSRKGSVKFDGAVGKTPAEMVDILYHAIGIIEKLYPTQTPYPKVFQGNPDEL